MNPHEINVRAWDEIEGQDRPKDLLRRAVERDRLHHGYLFVGPEGVGKFATALALSRILNCEARTAGEFTEACGTCPSCRKFANDLQHPDLHVVLPEGNVNKTVKIDQIRVLQKAAMTRPYEGRYQLVLIDDVHLMTDEAANALLKTLEEPPSTMKLFLVTDQPLSLLDTIRSRSQTVRFGALPRDVVVRILSEEIEDPPSRTELAVAAAFGEGSVGRSKELIESGTLAERTELFETLSTIERERPAALLKAAAELAKDRNRLVPRFDLVKVILRDVLLVKLGASDERLVNADMRARVDAIAARYTEDDLLERVESVRIAQELLNRYVHSKTVVENLLTELAPGPAVAPVRLPKF